MSKRRLQELEEARIALIEAVGRLRQANKDLMAEIQRLKKKEPLPRPRPAKVPPSASSLTAREQPGFSFPMKKTRK